MSKDSCDWSGATYSGEPSGMKSTNLRCALPCYCMSVELEPSQARMPWMRALTFVMSMLSSSQTCSLRFSSHQVRALVRPPFSSAQSWYRSSVGVP